ncbi:hypothetical protein [Winogradskya humida]|uniref:hypothetical protein n=1 Tax=Winogradskya humida TaxID=113566 RepID=UPI001943E2D3|nr:hypothetical protein [Actinoplanes humidus]
MEDPGRAMSLYRSAAEGGDAIAAFNVGMMLGKSPAAVPWLRQAAEAGVTEAYPVRGDRLSEQDLDDEALRWSSPPDNGSRGCRRISRAQA